MTYSNIEELRAERNARLAACDYTMLVDFKDKTPVGEIQALKLYRQVLRDITESISEDATDIEIEWPNLPYFS